MVKIALIDFLSEIEKFIQLSYARRQNNCICFTEFQTFSLFVGKKESVQYQKADCEPKTEQRKTKNTNYNEGNNGWLTKASGIGGLFILLFFQR